MANTIKPKRSSVAGNIPTILNISQYEIAMNTADKKIFTSDGTNIIQLASGNLTGLSDVQVTTPTQGQSLSYNAITGKWVNSDSGSGDVIGPTGATDNAIARFDTTTGKLIQNSVVTISDTGAMSGVESISTLNFAQFNTSNASVVDALGALSWDQVNRTLNISMGNGVNQSVGQELPVPVQSSTNNGLINGKVVYIVGSNGDNQLVEYAQANAETTSSKAFGVMTETVSGGAKGLCTTFGYVHDLDTSALTEGAAIWLSPTVSGGMTTTKPTAPNHLVLIGWCTRSHATTGVVFVKIQNGYELDELHDVLITSKADGDSLYYEAATGVWKNLTPAAAKTVLALNNVENKSSATIRSEITSTNVTTALGYTPYNSTNPNGYTSNTGTVTSVSGSGSVAGLSLSGTVTTSGSLSLSGTLSASIDNITDEYRVFNNMGANHTSYTDFNTSRTSGVNYMQGGTNGPTGNASHQFYGFKLGLGNDYDPSNSYASQLYWARQAQAGGTYLWARDMEGGSWGSWRKMSAGYADTAGNGGVTSVNGQTGAVTVGGFPSGTAMLFAQTSAPTGWTKQTTHNDKALRVVSGTAGSGGSVAFSTAFASKTPSGSIGNTTVTGSVSVSGSVSGTTLGSGEIPSHRHYAINNANVTVLWPPPTNINTGNYVAGSGVNRGYENYVLTASGSDANVGLTSATGGSGSHSHGFSGSGSMSTNAHSHTFAGNAIDLTVQYVDVIIATKD